MGADDAVFGTDGGSRDLGYGDAGGISGEDGVGRGYGGEAREDFEFEGEYFLGFYLTLSFLYLVGREFGA